MSDSALSNIVTATSPTLPPAPPVLGIPTFFGLVAAIPVTLPATDAIGNALVNPLVNIKVFFGPSGSDLSEATPVTFPGSYAPGVVTEVQVPVPNWNTAYDFDAEVSD